MSSARSSTLSPPICWDNTVPPIFNTRAIAGHGVLTGWRQMTRSNTASRKGSSGESLATSCTPRPRNRAAANGTFGGHGSVAAITGGNASRLANISPPPVCTSRAAETDRRRSATKRE